jgi:hypothetical protein
LCSNSRRSTGKSVVCGTCVSIRPHLILHRTRLVSYLERAQSGAAEGVVEATHQDAQVAKMKELVQRYSTFAERPLVSGQAPALKKRTVVSSGTQVAVQTRNLTRVLHRSLLAPLALWVHTCCISFSSERTLHLLYAWRVATTMQRPVQGLARVWPPGDCHRLKRCQTSPAS